MKVFQSASMKTSIEGAFGINTHLSQISQNIVLHADVNYHHKLKKVSVSETHI